MNEATEAEAVNKKRRKWRLLAILSFVVLALGIGFPALIATVLALILPLFFRSGAAGTIAATQVGINKAQCALKTIEMRVGDYPPSRLEGWGIEGNNRINEGSEALVLALSAKENGLYIDWEENDLENCDGDCSARVPALTVIRVEDLFEFFDFWGNPIVYIHNRDYGKKFTYVTIDGESFNVSARKSCRLGTYHNANSYQMWSFGPNWIDENGSGDDVANFIADPDKPTNMKSPVGSFGK